MAEDIVRVRDATDIVALISAQVALRKSGRRWQGLCPFHAEKTPSFSVNAEEGLYYCFGCRASGDAITFVRETEGLDFAACVELLASRAGIALRYDNKGEADRSGRRKQLVEAVAAAVDWYHDVLLRHGDARAARAYLRARGMDGTEVRKFQVGWAPTGWSALCSALRKKFPEQVLIEAGLARRSSNGGTIDNFRARVLFPVFDARGDPVGFGGRILPDADASAGPKYKNSAESAIYAKSRLLYGLNWAKEAIVTGNEVIVSEGYTDVIGLHAAGLPHAVATCGTALTEEHIKALRRFVPRIVLAFDADAAGSAAAERIYQWERAHEIDVYVAALPPGADPDGLARSDPGALREAIATAAPYLTYRMERALARGNLTTAEGRVRAADAAVAVVDEHPSTLVRDQYLMQVAYRCHLDPDGLREVVTQYRAARRRVGDGGRSPGTTAEASTAAGAAGAGAVTTTEASNEEQVLLLRLHAPEEFPTWLGADLFGSAVARNVFEALGTGASLQELRDVAEGPTADLLARLAAWDPSQLWEPGSPADTVIGRFVYNAATRRIPGISSAARRIGDITSAGLGRRWGEAILLRGQLGENLSLPLAKKLAELLAEEELAAPGPASGSASCAAGPSSAPSQSAVEEHAEQTADADARVTDAQQATDAHAAYTNADIYAADTYAYDADAQQTAGADAQQATDADTYAYDTDAPPLPSEDYFFEEFEDSPPPPAAGDRFTGRRAASPRAAR